MRRIIRDIIKNIYEFIKNNSIWLIVISGLIILISTIGFGIIIPRINSEIDVTQQEISNITKQLDVFEFNAKMQSDQLVKIASTYGDYKILNALNSSYTNEFKDHLRRQMYQSIVILRGKGINSTEKIYLEKLNYDELEKELERYWKESIKRWNKIDDDKRDKEDKILKLVKKRNSYNLIFVIVQVIGLFIGIVGDFFSSLRPR